MMFKCRSDSPEVTRALVSTYNKLAVRVAEQLKT